MKKSVLLIVGLLATAASAVAQPKKPTVTYTDWASAEEKVNVYLYNVEAGMFLSAGNNWGTRATLINDNGKGNGNGGYSVSYNQFITLESGLFKGNKWFIAASEENRNGKSCYKLQNISGSGALAADDANGIWVDGGDTRPVANWYIIKANSDKTFQLGYFAATPEKDDEGNDVKDGDGNVVIKSYDAMGFFGAKNFTEGDMATFFDPTNEAYSVWALVSETEYEAKEPEFKLYFAGQGLEKLLADADKLGLDVDLKAYKAILNKDGVTLDELSNAINKLRPAISFGNVIAEAKATDANRDWSKFETIYADPESTDAIFTENTTLIKELLALKSKLDEASEKYTTLDFSEPSATYDNVDATLEEVQAAETKIDEIINDYNLNHASVENPANISNTLTNITDNVTDWTREFTGEGEIGTFHQNTWSTEGNSDGTNMTTPFIEDWVAGGSTLSDQKFYRNTVTVEPGAYKITGNIRLYNESGAEYMKGAYLFANSNRSSLFANEEESKDNAAEGAVYGTFQESKLYYWKDGFDTYAIVPENGKLTFGIQIEGANFNWTAAKNFQVYFLGDSYESLDYVRQNTELTLPEFEEGTLATKQLLEDYQNAAQAYASAKDAASIMEAYATMNELGDSLTANIAAYKEYADKVAEYKEKLDGLYGDDADILAEYLDDLGEELGPDSDEAIDMGYENGYSAYILANGNATTDGIKKEIELLEKLYDNAVKNSLEDGTDLTALIVNPGFEIADGKGWKLDTSEGGTGTLTNWHGGNSTNYCAEAYQQNFDVYQEIEGVKDGLYEISVQAFYRTGANNVAWEAYKNDPTMEGDAKVYPEVYLNEFSSKIRNVMEIQFASGELDANNTNAVEHTDVTPSVWTLDGMTSASNAFSLEDPARNFTMSAYGLVQGGKLRIGIRKLEGPTTGSVWTLWDNFKLTFRAKNPEIMKQVLADKSAELEEFLNVNENEMTTPALNDADYALKESKKSDLSDDAMWDVLIETNAALNKAKKNLTGVENNKTAVDAYDTAVEALAKVDPSESNEIWNEISAMDAEKESFADLTTEELVALNEKLAEITEKVKEATTAIETEEVKKEMASATDDNPYDATDKFIKNANMEEGDSNTMTGWDFYKAGGNGPALASGIEGRSFETWSSDAANAKFALTQQLTNLPAGKYELSVTAGHVANGVEADYNNYMNEETRREGRVYLVAYTTGEAFSTAIAPSEGSKDDNAVSAAQPFSLIFTVGEDGKANIGLQSKGTLPFRWFVADNFKLTYFGANSAKADNSDAGDLVAIEGTDAPVAKTVAGIYTTTGAQVSSLQKGINIVKYADGSVKKVLVK